MATTEQEVKVKLDVPFMTNGVTHGVEIIDGKKVFTGVARVPKSVAEDLERRQDEYRADQRRLLKNGGKVVDSLNGGTLQG